MYVKLFASILDSSIWSENYPTRLVWITLLAMADAEGLVRASVSGIARRAAVKRLEAEAAVKALCSPDRDRPDQEHDGRRLEVVDGGWKVLNYQKYREIRTQQQFRDALRQQRHRDRLRVSRDASQQADAEAVSEAEAEQSKALVARGATAESLITELRSVHQNGKAKAATRDALAQLVFAYWAAKWDKPKTLLDAKRLNRLKARLRENADNVSELLYVVDGSKRDEWEDRPKYAGIEQLFRDRGTVERLAGFAPGHKKGETHPMAAKYAGNGQQPA